MTYTKAKELVDLNKHLIGLKIREATIDELIIYPTDNAAYDVFLKIYLRTLCSEKAIDLYKNQDVEVCCIIDKKTVVTDGFLTQASLQRVSQEHAVNF